MQSSINTVFIPVKLLQGCLYWGVDRKSTHVAQLPNFHRKKHHIKTMEALKAVVIKVT